MGQQLGPLKEADEDEWKDHWDPPLASRRGKETLTILASCLSGVG
jgi:hypothetical protein